MHLVNDKDNIAQPLDLVDQTLHAAFKLPAELGACDKCRQVKQMDLLIAHFEGDSPFIDAYGQPFGHGGFADARFADQTGIVLLTAVEDLDHAVGLAVTSNNVVNAALRGLAGQVVAVIVQVFTLFILPRGGLGLAAAILLPVILLRQGGCGGGEAALRIGLVRRIIV